MSGRRFWGPLRVPSFRALNVLLVKIRARQPAGKEPLRLFHQHKGALPECGPLTGWIEDADLAAIFAQGERAEADLEMDGDDAHARA